MKPPPPGPLAPSQRKGVKIDFRNYPLDGWVKAENGRIREVDTKIGMMRLTILKADTKHWGFSIRLVTPVEGVVLRDWVNSVLVASAEKSEDEPWGWRPYAKTPDAEFRFSPSGAYMGYVHEAGGMAIISETVPSRTMRQAMRSACFFADLFSHYTIPEKVEVTDPTPESEPVTLPAKLTRTQRAILTHLHDVALDMLESMSHNTHLTLTGTMVRDCCNTYPHHPHSPACTLAALLESEGRTYPEGT